jgi:hypothetical protein
MKTNVYSRRIVCLALLILLVQVPSGLLSMAQETSPPRAEHQAQVDSPLIRPLSEQSSGPAPTHVLYADETTVARSGDTYTWAQTSQADWEQGTLEWLDSAATPGSLQLARQFFSPNEPLIPLQERASGQWRASVAMDGAGNTYAVWEDDRKGNADIYFAYRPAGGTWSDNEKANDDSGAADQRAPAIAVDGLGNAYALWLDGRKDAGNYDVYFACRPSGGTWSENVQVNDVSGSASSSDLWERPSALAVNGSGNAYALWTDERNGNLDIYFAYRPAGGVWEANLRVDDDPGTADQRDPAVAVDGAGNVYAAWTDQRRGNTDVYFAYRPAGGLWSNQTRINDDPGTAAQSSPAIAVDGSGNAYAAWTDERDDYGDIYFAYRSAGGTWGTNVRVNDDAEEQGQWSPTIGVDGAGNAYAAWTDERDLSEIYFAYRPAGAAWGANERINDQLGTADPWGLGPAIAIDGTSDACVVWTDYRHENEDIYAVYRPAGGAWTTNVLMNDDPGAAQSETPAVAVDGAGNTYAVWADRRNGNWDIYFAYRPTGGPWGTAVQVNEDPSVAGQWSPAIAVDGNGNAYVVWEDERNDEGDIYFQSVSQLPTW